MGYRQQHYISPHIQGLESQFFIVTSPYSVPRECVATTELDKNQMPKEPGAINGGLTKREAPIRSTVVTIDVADIDKAFERIQKLGGKMLRKKMEVGDMGYAAYFKDTEGNVVGLWQTRRK